VTPSSTSAGRAGEAPLFEELLFMLR